MSGNFASWYGAAGRHDARIHINLREGGHRPAGCVLHCGLPVLRNKSRTATAWQGRLKASQKRSHCYRNSVRDRALPGLASSSCPFANLAPPTSSRGWQVAERGLAFVRTFSELLAARQAEGHLPPLFREAWAHSACVSVAKTTFTAAQLASPQLEGQQQAPADRQGRPVGCAAYC
jgi:hypothetical protein